MKVQTSIRLDLGKIEMVVLGDAISAFCPGCGGCRELNENTRGEVAGFKDHPHLHLSAPDVEG